MVVMAAVVVDASGRRRSDEEAELDGGSGFQEDRRAGEGNHGGGDDSGGDDRGGGNGGSDDSGASALLDSLNDAVRDTGGFESDESVGGGIEATAASLDGGDDDFLAESVGGHAHDIIVGEGVGGGFDVGGMGEGGIAFVTGILSIADDGPGGGSDESADERSLDGMPIAGECGSGQRTESSADHCSLLGMGGGATGQKREERSDAEERAMHGEPQFKLVTLAETIRAGLERIPVWGGV